MSEIEPITDVFLQGEIVSLCVVDVEKDIAHGDWHSWFNDQYITTFLEHGVWPVSAAQEVDIVRDQLANSSSLILKIVGNEHRQLIGVISLKDINFLLRRAEIGMVTNGQRVPGAALEAMALMTEHAFERLNLAKVYCGQHDGLWKWVNTLALIGYHIEGLQRSQGFRANSHYDVFLTGITSTEYRRLKSERGGNLLQGGAKELAATRSNINQISKLRTFFEDLNSV